MCQSHLSLSAVVCSSYLYLKSYLEEASSQLFAAYTEQHLYLYNILTSKQIHEKSISVSLVFCLQNHQPVCDSTWMLLCRLSACVHTTLQWLATTVTLTQTAVKSTPVSTMVCTLSCHLVPRRCTEEGGDMRRKMTSMSWWMGLMICMIIGSTARYTSIQEKAGQYWQSYICDCNSQSEKCNSYSFVRLHVYTCMHIIAHGNVLYSNIAIILQSGLAFHIRKGQAPAGGRETLATLLGNRFVNV